MIYWYRPKLGLGLKKPLLSVFVQSEAAFFMSHSRKEVRLMLKRHQLRERLITLYWCGVGLISAGLVSIQPVMADNIFDRIQSIVADIYGQLVAISTIVAVTVASIALIVRMISRNQRAVDEATSWLKRIVVAWIVLNSLGFIVAYLQPLVAGGQYTG